MMNIVFAFQVRVTEGGGESSGFSTSNVLTWTSANLSPDTDVTVQVRAINGFGEGALSNSLNVKTKFGGML